MQLRRVEERVERQHRLVDPALGVEVDVRVGGVGPARRHLLGPGRDAVVPLDLVVADRRPGQDLVGTEVEHVVRGVLVEEELRRSDEILGSRLDGKPGLGVVRVERSRAAGTGQRYARPRRYGIAAARRRGAGDHVRERHSRTPEAAARAGGRGGADRRSGGCQHHQRRGQSLHESSLCLPGK
jgi:hypothetical protein